MLFTRYTCKNLIQFHYTLVKAQLFFNIVSISVNSHISLLNNSTYSCPAKVALLLLQPLAHDVLQCLVICITVSSLAIFQRTKQAKIWMCKVRTMGHMKQQCPSKFCDCLSSVHICMWPSIVMDEQHIIHFSCGTYSPKTIILTS
jgi:hypothetical protein